MFKKSLLSFIVAIVFIFPACQQFKPEVKEIHSITQASDELQKADLDTLVVFDIDQTLIEPTEMLMYWSRFFKLIN